MLISFIIPAYNSEKCIAQCITSIVTASVDNTIYEVIIINDGSVDTTLEICTELANKYPQIIVIDQVNVGTSCARNAGLGIARGEYIWFVDSDDCIETSILNKLMEYLQTSRDIDMLSFNYEHNGVVCHDIIDNKVLAGVEFLLCNSRLYLWNHIYSRRLIGMHRFLSGTKNIEDLLFNVEVLVNADTIVKIEELGYHYKDDNQVSTSRNRSKRNLIKLSQDSFAVQKRLLELAAEQNKEEKYNVIMNVLETSVAGHLFSLFRFYSPNRVKRACKLYGQWNIFPLTRIRSKKAKLFMPFIRSQWLVSVFMNIGKLVNR